MQNKYFTKGILSILLVSMSGAYAKSETEEEKRCMLEEINNSSCTVSQCAKSLLKAGFPLIVLYVYIYKVKPSIKTHCSTETDTDTYAEDYYNEIAKLAAGIWAGEHLKEFFKNVQSLAVGTFYDTISFVTCCEEKEELEVAS